MKTYGRKRKTKNENSTPESVSRHPSAVGFPTTQLRGGIMRINRWLSAVRALVFMMAFGSAAAAAFGQPRTTGRTFDPTTLGMQILSTIVFGFIGIFMIVVGFKMFDAVIRFNLAEEICEKQNVAASILCGAMLIAIGMIIAVAVY